MTSSAETQIITVKYNSGDWSWMDDEDEGTRYIVPAGWTPNDFVEAIEAKAKAFGEQENPSVGAVDWGDVYLGIIDLGPEITEIIEPDPTWGIIVKQDTVLWEEPDEYQVDPGEHEG